MRFLSCQGDDPLIRIPAYDREPNIAPPFDNAWQHLARKKAYGTNVRLIIHPPDEDYSRVDPRRFWFRLRNIDAVRDDRSLAVQTKRAGTGTRAHDKLIRQTTYISLIPSQLKVFEAVQWLV